ncbi:MAG: Ig-like domain-containing protein [Ilumatobacteraceae bacterium]
MTTRFGWLAMAAAAVSLVVGFEAGHASAAGNQAPVVTSGSMTVRYDETYSVHFTASDPDGDSLTVVTPPTNDDWLGCDGGPATDFTCNYSSSRYYDPAPLPTEPFQRTISYTVTDGTMTSTGVWTVTVLPPPTMQITGDPTVAEGGDAVLKLELSSNPYGSLLVLAHTVAYGAGDDTGVPADLMIDVADGQTTADVHIPIADDSIDGPTRHFSVVVDQVDAIPYRFVVGGNLVTVLDNDGKPASDTTPPVVGKHRDMIVERAGGLPARVSFSPPSATDDVDGVVPVVCVPGSMSVMPRGRSSVLCTATDKAGNLASTSFGVTLRRPMSAGSAQVFGGFYNACAEPGQMVWVTTEGFTPGSPVTIALQASDQQVIRLQTTTADRRGRVHQVVTVPSAAAGDADLVVTGTAGPNDLVRMLPLRVARGHHHDGGELIAFLRHRECD